MAAQEQEELLLVQAADTAADQLRHRRGALPERSGVAAAEADAVAAKRIHEGLVARVAELAERQAELENQLGATEGRASAVEARLRSGESTAARDIVRWGEEVDHLRERAARLEDEAFEVLVQREATEAELASGAERLAAAVAAVRRERAELTAAEESVDAELALSPRDLDDARRAPHEAVLACEACGRILVRT